MDIVIFIILILLSALFAGSETALFSLRESQVRIMVKNKEWNASVIARLKGDPHRLLATLLSGNTVVNISVGSLAAVSVAESADSIGVGLVTGIVTVLILLFGEIFPKSFAIMYNRRVAQFVAYPIFICYLLLFPITSIFVWIEQGIRKATNAPTHGAVTEEEIRVMSDLGLEHGEIDHAEREMIENIFDFDDIPISAVMTKKEKIDSLNGEVPVEQIAYYVSQSGFSRFPVYDGNPNEYIGYVHTNDVMRVLNSDDRGEPLIAFASHLSAVDESSNLRLVFRQMTKERSHMYLVHAEKNPGEIVGLVTMENILEEIVGEIEDEGDLRARHKKNS
jgi:putative hemolysin